MSARRFRIVLDVGDELPPICGLAPPSPELYEALCRAAVDRALRIQQRIIAPDFGDGRVGLSGEYQHTLLQLTGTLEGRPAGWNLELYEPGFYRRRQGRLDSPATLANQLEFWFAEQLGWLWADSNDAMTMLAPIFTGWLIGSAGA